MKNLNRISTLLLSLFFSIMSCEKNNEPEKYQEISAEQLYLEQKISSTNMEKVSLDRIPQVARYLKEFTGNQIFSKNNKSAPIIDTENIIAISDTLGNTNYSFGFYLPNQKKNKKGRLYNLIVGVNNEGIMSNPMVLRLTPDKKHMEEWIENDLDFAHFNGKVSLHKFTDYFERNPFETGTDYCPPEFDQNGDPIECVIDEVTSGGSGTSSGGSYAPSGGVSGGCTYSMYWNYCGGTNEGIAHPSGPAPVCGGDGSGAGWVLETTCPNYTDITIFHKNGMTAASDGCADCATGPSGSVAINDYSKSVVKLDYYLDHYIDYQLTYSQLTWLNINPDKAYAINQFLKLNGFSEGNVSFAKIAVTAFMHEGIVNFNERLIEYNSIYDKLLRNMSPKERQIYDNELNSTQKTLYLSSAVQAYLYAEAFYDRPVRNRIGDAVKHSMWNALSASRIGVALTKKLTDAHEEIAYDSNYPNHYKETQMDYFNNSVGRNIGKDKPSRIFVLIEAAKNAGELRYLSNLTYKNGFYNATNNSTLIPTNQ